MPGKPHGSSTRFSSAERARYLRLRFRPADVDDQWMLDRWSNPASHQIVIVSRELQTVSEGTTRDYKAVCSCGWESLPSSEPTREPCPVIGALVERLKRVVG